MELRPEQRRYLRTLAHGRKVIVSIGGAGLTTAVLAEIEQALDHHELVKIRIHGADRDNKRHLGEAIMEATGAALVQRIGHVLTLYRPARQPRIELP